MEGRWFDFLKLVLLLKFYMKILIKFFSAIFLEIATRNINLNIIKKAIIYLAYLHDTDPL